MEGILLMNKLIYIGFPLLLCCMCFFAIIDTSIVGSSFFNIPTLFLCIVLIFLIFMTVAGYKMYLFDSEIIKSILKVN